ncbi:hypothetical protein MMC14_000471 [Varicellaria rhodocarpa]|nr:hypothetical protein [Varicellaria rhodocarpa]
MRLLASFSLVPLALASPLLQSRTCPKPTEFDISQYSVFTQAANQQGYTPQYGSSISFKFSDTTTSISTSCSRSLPPLAGPIADANHYYNCTNPVVKFLYDGSTLYVKEQFACNKKTNTATGSLGNSGDCYPDEPPIPGGYGTTCVIPGSNSETEVAVTSITSP